MWTDVMNLKVTEVNQTWAHILIGFYPIVHNCGKTFTTELAHASGPGYGAVMHIKADVPYSAFSDQGKEFEMQGFLKVVCLSVSMSACVSVCVFFCMCVCPWCSPVCLLCPSVCLPGCVSAFLFIYYVYCLIVSLSVCLFIFVCVSVCLYLSVCPFCLSRPQEDRGCP